MQFAGTGRPPGKGAHVTAKSSLIIRRMLGTVPEGLGTVPEGLEAGKAHNGPELSFSKA